MGTVSDMCAITEIVQLRTRRNGRQRDRTLHSKRMTRREFADYESMLQTITLVGFGAGRMLRSWIGNPVSGGWSRATEHKLHFLRTTPQLSSRPHTEDCAKNVVVKGCLTVRQHKQRDVGRGRDCTTQPIPVAMFSSPRQP